MYVGEADGIGDDCVSHKWCSCIGVGIHARPPAASQHLGDHMPLFVDFTGLECFHARNKARILHHVLHRKSAKLEKRVRLLRTAMSSLGLPPIEKNSRPEF